MFKAVEGLTLCLYHVQSCRRGLHFVYVKFKAEEGGLHYTYIMFKAVEGLILYLYHVQSCRGAYIMFISCSKL